MPTYKIVNSEQLDADLKVVADAIRAKGGTTDQLSFPEGMKQAVEAISSGGDSTKIKAGTYTMVTAIPTFFESLGPSYEFKENISGTFTKDGSSTSFESMRISGNDGTTGAPYVGIAFYGVMGEIVFHMYNDGYPDTINIASTTRVNPVFGGLFLNLWSAS